MVGRRFQFLAIGLAACLLFLSGSLLSQVAQHALDHAHHKATTHASPLCAWICTAGEIHQGFALHLEADGAPAVQTDAPVVQNPLLILSLEVFSRGPPLSLT